MLTLHRLRHKRHSGRLVDAKDRVSSQGCLSYSIKYQVQHGSDLYCDGGESDQAECFVLMSLQAT